MGRGESARRGTPAWCYSQLLTKAFYLVGVTELFDKLEQAELTGKRIDLVYPDYTDCSPPIPCGIKLVEASQPFDTIGEAELVDEVTAGQQISAERINK